MVPSAIRNEWLSVLSRYSASAMYIHLLTSGHFHTGAGTDADDGSGASGASQAGRGGRGGGSAPYTLPSNGVSVYSIFDYDIWGSGGGSYNPWYSGGRGGGQVILYSTNMTLDGQILASGLDGQVSLTLQLVEYNKRSFYR